MTAQQADNLIKHLQRRPTAAETKFWRRCRNQKIGGFDFRQHRVFLLEQASGKPIHFLIDFYCAKRKLAIELSGPGPLLSERNYQSRLEQLRRQHNIRVLHFTDIEILTAMEEAVETILKELECREYEKATRLHG